MGSSRGGLACKDAATQGSAAAQAGAGGSGAAAGVLRCRGGSRMGRRQPTRGAGRLRRLLAGVLRRGGGRTGLVRRVPPCLEMYRSEIGDEKITETLH